ncbi:MAG TPA: cystathionine gamma-synthase [Gammaproteobacteria bacterium]|nr:cystathionine gamma-synthase [Gammaproteobacteria bacterium]
MTHRASSRTRAVRAGIASETQYGAVVPPLHLSSNFTFADLGRPRAYDYTRSANPTRDQLGTALAELEGGAGAVVTGSGMSAIHLVTQLLSPGDLLIAPHDCYGGSNRLFNALAEKNCIRVRFVDQTDPLALEKAFDDNPSLLWVETPSNPLLRIVDIEAAARLCREHNALLAVDNTFLSPGWQQPIPLGADLVVHSTTKYLNGHSDVVGGVAIARDAPLAEQLTWWGNCLGITGAPFDSYLTLRGVRTLSARLRVHEENAHAVVDGLLEHRAVKQVHYPGLKDHPGHEIAKKQQSGFGAMVSFRIEGGLESVKTFIGTLEHFSLAESLGGVESLVAHPATMTHKSMSDEAKARAGIDDDLIRLSVGIEDADDLIADLKRALDTTLAVKKTRALTVAA